VIDLAHQIRHIRSSIRGKRFWAGKKLESIEEQEPEEINILDKEQELEIDEKNLEKIKKETGKTEDEIFDRISELNTNEPTEIIESFEDEK
jgi:hypothetical protein